MTAALASAPLPPEAERRFAVLEAAVKELSERQRATEAEQIRSAGKFAALEGVTARLEALLVTFEARMERFDAKMEAVARWMWIASGVMGALQFLGPAMVIRALGAHS